MKNLNQIKENIKKIEFYMNKMETASTEDKIFCYEPMIEQLKEEIRILSK